MCRLANGGVGNCTGMYAYDWFESRQREGRRAQVVPSTYRCANIGHPRFEHLDPYGEK